MNIFKVNKKTVIANRKLRELIDGLKPRFDKEVQNHRNVVTKLPDGYTMVSNPSRNQGTINGIAELLEIYKHYSDLLEFVYVIDRLNSRRKTILNEDEDFEECMSYYVYISKKSLDNAAKKYREDTENYGQQDQNVVPCSQVVETVTKTVTTTVVTTTKTKQA